jgi:hypothetical protein
MKKSKYIFVTLASASIVGAGAIGVASAASTNSNGVLEQVASRALSISRSG